MRDQRRRTRRGREEPAVAEHQRHPRRLLVDVEVLLPHATVGEAHFAVVGGLDDQRVVGEAKRVELVQHGDQRAVGGLHQVGVEIEVVALHPRRRQRPEPGGGQRQELPLHRRLGVERLPVGVRNTDAAGEPAAVVSGLFVGVRVKQHVVRVDEGDDQEERLLGGRHRREIGEHALLARRRLAVGVHVAPVVVGDAATALGDVLVGASVRRVPAPEAVALEVGRHPLRTRGLAAVPLALVHDVEASRRHHGRQVGQVDGQLALRILVGRHALLERVLDPVLGGEEARHQRRARGRAHAGIGERVLEGQPMAREAGQARQVPLGPARREVLDRPLLVGDEEDDVLRERSGGRCLGEGRGRRTRRRRRARSRRGAGRRRQRGRRAEAGKKGPTVDATTRVSGLLHGCSFRAGDPA